MSKLVIVGAGEFAQIAYEYFTHDSDFEVVAFAVDEQYIPVEPVLCGLPVVAINQLVDLFPPASFQAFVAIPLSGMNVQREQMCSRIKSIGYSLATYVSSKAFVWRNVEIGENTFIFEGNVLQPWTKVGNRCVLWSGNHIGHRTVIEDDVFLSSHCVVSGYCRIGHHSFLGVNSTVNDNIIISEFTFLGAASQLNRNTTPHGVYVGIPAKQLQGVLSEDLGK